MKKLLSIGLALVLNIASQAQIFEVDTISMTGSINDRINLVFLADGYQEDELDKFIEDVHWMEDALLGKEPYRTYRDYFNSFAIKVPSEVSGAANDPDSLIDNYFGSTFNSSGIWRLVVPKRSGKIQSVLRDNFPQYDQVVVIVNDSRYGGSGGWAATSTTHTNGPEICIHEIGHSFAGLADEYWAGPQYARERVNMTRETDREQVKWKNWLDYRSTGIYPHQEDPVWNRPHQNCEMRYLNRQFCPVCQEAIADEILDLTNPIISYSPSEDGFTNNQSTINFSVNLLKPIPNTMRIKWTLNTDSIAANIDTLTISAEKLLPGENKVVAFILDTTKFIRSSSHSRSHMSKVIWDFHNTASGIHLDQLSSDRYSVDVYPNPVINNVSVSYKLPGLSNVVISLLTPQGKQIQLSEMKSLQMGTYTEKLDIHGLSLASGMYHIKMSIDDIPVLIPIMIK